MCGPFDTPHDQACVRSMIGAYQRREEIFKLGGTHGPKAPPSKVRLLGSCKSDLEMLFDHLLKWSASNASSEPPGAEETPTQLEIQKLSDQLLLDIRLGLHEMGRIRPSKILERLVLKRRRRDSRHDQSEEPVYDLSIHTVNSNLDEEGNYTSGKSAVEQISLTSTLNAVDGTKSLSEVLPTLDCLVPHSISGNSESQLTGGTRSHGLSNAEVRLRTFRMADLERLIYMIRLAPGK